MRLSTCPCFTLRQTPAAAARSGAALLLRAGYWRADGGETPLGAALRERLAQYLARAHGLDQPWSRAPRVEATTLLPETGLGTPRLAAVLAWGRTWLTSPRRVPITLAWEWTGPTGPLWGLYTWAWEPAPDPRVDWGLPQVVESPLGPGLDGRAWLVPAEHSDEALHHDRWARAATEPARPAPAAPFPQAPRPHPVPTPRTATVNALARQLGVTPTAVLKTLFWVARLPHDRGWHERLVAALVPGERRLDPWRLATALGAWSVRPATDAEMRAAGAVPGFASPVGLDPAALEVVLDTAALGRGPWVMGANRADTHLRHVLPGRDFPVDRVAALSTPAAHRPARLFAWAARVPPAWLQAAGVEGPPAPARRALALHAREVDPTAWAVSLAEAHHDERGLTWPPPFAPLDVHLVRLLPRRAAQQEPVQALAEQVAQALRAAGFRVLDDDRNLSPGVKFADADWMGLPWRVVVSVRSAAQGQVELKARTASQAQVLPVDALVPTLREAVA